LQQQVFEAYGITNPGPDAYEIDYLITPDLGGAANIRNLWPQPYNTIWNAQVKDQLEERLHAMVCSGEIDLATAQRDLATDWVRAYKKYFRTDRPQTGRRGARTTVRQTDVLEDLLSVVTPSGAGRRGSPDGSVLRLPLPSGTLTTTRRRLLKRLGSELSA
jgi:hypothetical protein